ncbi:transmembrane channel-like protein 5 isoform X2 [Micropterus dolomieu]|uniref:transmembrane channel-like protein 5 isoform X2 n=1 Tax=Micropterus dolomieu TaxID=147949 RepID=UPI001E8E0F40|nr:transmembrane channel-like protein 5 isoform X2 [Micropterus dolomieu]XP_045902207.1 transmembrane channel-like protein 5 isoform X2 [Micropterus dolomieu]
MTSYSNGGFFNPAYHDSDTLEIDRRSSSKTHHTNPYPREDLTWRDEGAAMHYSSTGQTSGDDAVARVPWGGWQEESWRGIESIPMGLISTRPGSPSWQHDLNHSTFQIPPESQYDRSSSARLPSSTSGNMTMRWRGISMRRMSMFPNADPAHLAFTEDAIRNEMENEEQNLVKELVALSTRDRIRAIRGLPMSFDEKKHIRSQVLAFKSYKQSRQFTCFADCSENVSLSFRRCGYSIRSARQTLELWQGIMKEIGGKFGTSVLSYFLFLKWLLVFNIFSFVVNFGFITIPLLVSDPSPDIPLNVSFRGLEILTGAGYFTYTVMYYGGYSNKTLVGLVEYNMQLAYFFTIAVYMVLCGIALIYSMASSFKNNYVLADPSSNSAWQLLSSWDFSITNERAVRQRKNNIRVQLKESLSEKAQRELLTLSEKLKHSGVYLGSWLLSTSLAFGCGASIYYLCQYEQQQATDSANWSLLQEAETLLVPFVVSLMNLVVPLFYSLFNKFEHYSNQRRQIYALVVRNVLLKMSILAVLCYYWMNEVAKKFSCWESMVGQALYRLVIVDFLFLMLGSFFGEFLSNVIGTRLLPRLGVPEFDVARNVLELIYAQTLAWIGIYFSPLLPAIQILKFFILFYLKKVSLTQNCQPPRRAGRAAQMQTIFIALLFFPFFVGALSIVAYTAWRLTPSEQCGPFRGLNTTFSVVGVWIGDLENIPGSQWAVWIYQNVIRSEIFYFLITLIIIVIIYIFWQVSQGRRQLIGKLRQQIINAGKDKSFLLEKLQNLQKSQPNKKSILRNPKNHTKRRSDDHFSGGQSNSNAMVQALLARQQLEDEEKVERRSGVPVPSDISTSSALAQAMLARQGADDQDEGLYWMLDKHPSSSSALAQAMQARQRAQVQEGEEYYSTEVFSESPVNTSVSNVMMQVMQRAEEEDRMQWAPAPPQNPAPAGSSALIQAMLARQQAQNEYDDGY